MGGKNSVQGKESTAPHTCRTARDHRGPQGSEETSRKGLRTFLHPTEPEPPEHRGFRDQQFTLPSPTQHHVESVKAGWISESRLSSQRICAHNSLLTYAFISYFLLSGSYSCPCLLAVLFLFVDCLVRLPDHCWGFSSGSLQGSLYSSAYLTHLLLLHILSSSSHLYPLLFLLLNCDIHIFKN